MEGKGSRITKLTAAILGVLSAANVSAAVSAEEAKQLGGPVLTIFGAERAGNSDGSIPAFPGGDQGEVIKPPASYDPKEPRRLPDPFNDKPLFSITAQNMDKYADKLNDTQKNLLKTTPGYRLDIYPTRRTAYFEKYALENTLKNATSCKGGPGELTLEGCYGGIMFPIPKTGNQVMWNHLTRYVGQSWTGGFRSYYVTPEGKPVLQSISAMHQQFPIYDGKSRVLGPDDAYYRVRQDSLGPARRVGEKLVITFKMDPLGGSRVYQYLPGQRRVKLAPDLAYDTPNPTSAGAATMDENNGFFGAQDRYDFKLMGKKEMYIMYNSYNTYDYKKCPEAVLYKKGFLNPDCVRWELHRVWVVEGKLKPGFRHIYLRRMFYFDEDLYGPGSTDNYDAAGKLYRGDFVGHFRYYNPGVGVLHNYMVPSYAVDAQTGAYYASSEMSFQDGGGMEPELPKADIYYSPEALAGQGIR